MSLGQAKTRAFNLGTAELRIMPLSASGAALSAHSVGLVDSVTVEVAQESVRLEGGFPRKLVDTAIASQTATVTGALREVSRRNLKVLLGQGVGASEPADVATTMAGSATIAGATSITVTSATGITAGSTIVVYPKGKPELLSVCLVDSVSTNVLTLNTNTPLLVAYDPATNVEIFNAQPIPIGAVDQVQYFGVQVIQRNWQNGRPRVFDFWKGAVSAGMTFETSNQDYGTQNLQIEILEPSVEDYATGGPLEKLANIIPAFPSGRMAFGAV